MSFNWYICYNWHSNMEKNIINLHKTCSTLVICHVLRTLIMVSHSYTRNRSKLSLKFSKILIKMKIINVLELDHLPDCSEGELRCLVMAIEILHIDHPDDVVSASLNILDHVNHPLPIKT